MVFISPFFQKNNPIFFNGSTNIKLYNSSKYVLLPSASEGIGLPMIEGMICGAIPITCSDNLTAKEFSPADFICKPDAQSIVNKLTELNKDYRVKRELALKFGKKYKIQLDKKNIAKNIIKKKFKHLKILISFNTHRYSHASANT